MRRYLLSKAGLLCLLLFQLSTLQLFAQEVLLGLTPSSGSNGEGTAFSVLSDGSNFRLHRKFLNMGASPKGDLVKGPDGYYYGMTEEGNGYGRIFKMGSSGVITVLHALDGPVSEGGNPKGSLVFGNDGYLYGMTSK